MPAVPVEMKKSRQQVEENEEEIINRNLQQQIYNTELHPPITSNLFKSWCSSTLTPRSSIPRLRPRRTSSISRSTTWSCCPPATAMKERRSLWPAGWYPENWFSSSSSQPMSPPRTGGTGRRTRKASGPSSPDLNRFSSSPNMFCTVNCWPRPSISRGQLSMPISQYTSTFYMKTISLSSGGNKLSP